MPEVWNKRRVSECVDIVHGPCRICLGGGAPVCVQSMTNTPTEDIEASVAQVLELARAGSELVRLTVNTPQAARAIPAIREALDAKGCFVPLVGDFHYNGHKLLAEEPACAEALSKYRINPGNVGKGESHDANFASMVEMACRHGKAVRIGVNGGSVDPELLESMLEANRASHAPISDHDVMLYAIVESTVGSAKAAESLGLPANRLVLSAKVSDVTDLVWVYRELAARGSWALHLGLTEAGIGMKGLVSSTAALSVLLSEGIGDTIRVSITPGPGEARRAEVCAAREILQALGLRFFTPRVTSCPGCGRTSNALFGELASRTQAFVTERMHDWEKTAPGAQALRVAVMGCVVNGPGEAKNADIGISLPGRSESPVSPVFIAGKKVAALKGETVFEDFTALIERYVQQRWGKDSIGK